MSTKSIYIFSDTIQSGKTTFLEKWIIGRENIGGILTPDQNGLRKLKFLSSQTTKELQIDDDRKAVTEKYTTVGKFTFLSSAFNLANAQIISDVKTKKFDWILIDEVGKLELKDQGLHQAVSSATQYFKSDNSNSSLLLVVRDYLLDEVIEKYALQEAQVLHKLDFLDLP